MKPSWFVVVALLGGCAAAGSDSAPRAGHEVVSGAGRIRGGGMRMDVAVGHAFAHGPVTSSGKTLKPVSTVTP